MAKTDDKLMAMIAEGKMRAFDELFKRYSKLVYGYCNKMLNNNQRAEDLAQETWMKVIRYAGNYKSQGKFTSWLITVTRNTVYNDLRSFKVTEELDENYHTHSEEFQAEDLLSLFEKQENHQILKLRISELPDAQRVALMLWLSEEMSYDEIAKEMSQSVAAVKSILFRAKKTLAEKFEGE